MKDPGALIRRGARIIREPPQHVFDTEFSRYAIWSREYEENWLRRHSHTIVVECWAPQRHGASFRELLSIIYMIPIARSEENVRRAPRGPHPLECSRENLPGRSMPSGFHPLERLLPRLAVTVVRQNGNERSRISYWDKQGTPLQSAGPGNPTTLREQKKLIELLEQAKSLMK